MSLNKPMLTCFPQNEDQSKELEEIQIASQSAGIDIQYTDKIPLPLPFNKATRTGGQAKFHPVQYVYGLANAFEKQGGTILENCRATGIEENEIAEVKTTKGVFKGKKVIYATHTPMGVNLIHLRCQPFRSYAMAVTLKDNNYPPGLAYDMYDPYHYYRTQVIDGRSFFIAGGYDHKTGKEEDTENCFRELEAHIRKHFNISGIKAKWSSQYFEPADGLPYVGRLPGHSDLVYTASGFGGNGITYSHVSALIFKSIFLNEESPYIKLFDPNRIKPVAGLKTL
ncbi:MAG: FAD-binding oxidoreductase [Bacteroidota bacterium]